jgi:hypothetical protein
VASFVLGILGFLVSIAGIPAIILGILAKKDIEKRGGELTGGTFATVGIVLGAVSTVLGLIFWFFIVMPNFREAQVRAKVARAMSDMRTLATGLEVYVVDNNAYPPACDKTGRIVPFNSSGVSAGYVPGLLTTPIEYLSSIPLDPFNTIEGPGGTPDHFRYRYATNGLRRILSSAGPDGVAQTTIEDFCDPEKANGEWEVFVSKYAVGPGVVFDPTNGTKSNGDIIRVGP